MVNGQKEMVIEEEGIVDFAQAHFHKFGGPDKEDSRWNGRQIRNAFQIAASLARYQNHQQPHRGLYVGAEHFQKVEEATREYDEFRKRTTLKTETELAASKMDRGPDNHTPQPDRRHPRRSPAHHRHDFGQPPQMQQSQSSPSASFGTRRSANWDYQDEPEGRARPAPYDASSGINTSIRPQAPRSSTSPSRSVIADDSRDNGGEQRWKGAEKQEYPPSEYSQY